MTFDLTQRAEYGLPGLLGAGVLLLVYRLIERGFVFQVPSAARTKHKRKP